MSSSSSSSKPPPPLRLHVDTDAATTTANGSAASPGSKSSSRSPRPSAAAASGPGGGQNQACAACKYQRRKCNPDCPLAPYFPADQQRRFLNAHRLFGVKNIQRTLRWIDPERGPDAMRALIYQSEARAADPVGGCVTIIEQLQRQIERTELELAYVKQQIAFYRQAAAVDPLADPAMILPPPDAAAAVAGQDHQDNAAAVAVGALYAGQEPVPPGAAGLVFQDQQGYHHHHVLKADQQNHPPPQQLYNYFCYDGTAADESTQDGSVQQFGGFADTSGLKIGSPPLATLGEQLEQQCQLDAFDVKPPGLRATTERHGPADELMRPDEDHHDVDQHMEEPATAVAAPCHLELGFSSF